MKKLLAFHNDPAIKRKYLARVRAHMAADELIHGKYWENGKGCAIGCTVHSSSRAAYEIEIGIPRVLATLEDGLFESLSNERSKIWPEQFLMAPKVGADLSLVWPKFAVWLLVDSKYGVIQFSKSEAGKKAIQDVAAAYQLVVDGTAQEINWRELRDAAAYDAAGAAAYDAAYAADADAAAYDAADAAAYDAAYDAAYAADAKRLEWRPAQADKLLELMAEA